MKAITTLFLLSFLLIGCGDTENDVNDPCADFGRRFEADFTKFKGMLDYEVTIRDRALEGLSNVASMTAIWKSYNQRTAEIRSEFNKKYAAYYKDCNPKAERL